MQQGCMKSRNPIKTGVLEGSDTQPHFAPSALRRAGPTFAKLQKLRSAGPIIVILSMKALKSLIITDQKKNIIHMSHG